MLDRRFNSRHAIRHAEMIGADLVDYYTPQHAAGSAEPFSRPDHRAKKHPRPAPKSRKNEKLGGGVFVFRRGRAGRIHPTTWPFEHPTEDSAIVEAGRLAKMTGDTFEVYSRVAVAGPVDGADCIDEAAELGARHDF
ncbi:MULTISPECIES: hypothetical protein [unclassified Sinorhizobium]|uniref:hypothetical protein n=1 Tax=unclassified Sinorhizobium TaxID=2613772 RepID=UPI0035252FA7